MNDAFMDLDKIYYNMIHREAMSDMLKVCRVAK